MGKLIVNIMLTLVLLCLFYKTVVAIRQARSAPGSSEEDNSAQGSSEEAKESGCKLRKEPITEINGCKTSGQAFRTSCSSGGCPSTSVIDPASSDPFSVAEDFTCCKANATKMATVNLHQCADYVMTATCDNKMTVYFDGVLQAASELDYWRETSTLSVPGNTQVVGIACENEGGPGGILASFTNGVVTDDGWHCSPEISDHWNEPGFTATWEPATAVRSTNYPTQNVFWIAYEGISDGAQWIWTSQFWDFTNLDNHDLYVYCRKVMHEFSYNQIESCECQQCQACQANAGD